MNKRLFLGLLIIIETLVLGGGLYLISQNVINTTSSPDEMNKLILENEIDKISVSSNIMGINMIDLVLFNDDIAISELSNLFKSKIKGIKYIHIVNNKKSIIGSTNPDKLYTTYSGNPIPENQDRNVAELKNNMYLISTVLKISNKRIGEIHVGYQFTPPFTGANSSNPIKYLPFMSVFIIGNIIILIIAGVFMPKISVGDLKIGPAEIHELAIQEEKLKDSILEMESNIKTLTQEKEEKNKILLDLNGNIVKSKEDETAILNHIEELQKREEELSKSVEANVSNGEGSPNVDVDEHVNVQIAEMKAKLDDIETDIAIKQKEIMKMDTNIELLKQEIDTLNENKNRSLSELNGVELELNKRILMKRREEIKLSQHVEVLRREDARLSSSKKTSRGKS
ncbi:hypothetical protein DRP43_04595, partial [candidate division TA06 bacterium]